MPKKTKTVYIAYLYVETGNTVRCTYRNTRRYSDKRSAIKAARESAIKLYNKYRECPGVKNPIEERKPDGTVIFRIPGLNEDLWPYVLPAEIPITTKGK